MRDATTTSSAIRQASWRSVRLVPASTAVRQRASAQRVFPGLPGSMLSSRRAAGFCFARWVANSFGDLLGVRDRAPGSSGRLRGQTAQHGECFLSRDRDRLFSARPQPRRASIVPGSTARGDWRGPDFRGLSARAVFSVPRRHRTVGTGAAPRHRGRSQPGFRSLAEIKATLLAWSV